MKEKKYGVAYYPKHIYKIIRWNNTKGGSPIISPSDFDSVALNEVYARTIVEFSLLMPPEKLFKAIETADYTLPEELIKMGLKSNNKQLPDEVIDLGFKINRFVKAHGPFSPLAIGAMNTIIWMERLGITEYKIYFALLERLDETPAKSFSDYIKIISEFEKELE